MQLWFILILFIGFKRALSLKSEDYEIFENDENACYFTLKSFFVFKIFNFFY